MEKPEVNKMKAVVLTQYNKQGTNLEIRDVPVPIPNEN